MKIRNGFVSNSSTSSFCIYGAAIDKSKVDEDAVEKAGLEYHRGDPNNGDDYVYIGRSWCSIKDDETGAQFKKNIEILLKEMFETTKCSTYEEAWRDG